jgi:UDP-glucose 4-epimerase
MSGLTENWLIVGGCGFIGTSLVHHLVQLHPGINLRVLDNLSVGTRQDLAEVCEPREVASAAIQGPPVGIELVVGDIRTFEDCRRACRGIRVVVHLAASTGIGPSVIDPRHDLECNVVGTFNMLEAARGSGVERLVFASSGAPLGEARPPIHEKKLPRPISPYGASKLAGEAYCSVYCRVYGLKTVVLRFGNVYGARSTHKDSVIAKFFKLALQQQPLEIYGNGNQTRDFLFIDDLLRSVMLAAQADVGGEIFQIASFKETTVNEIAEKIQALVARETGREVTIRHRQPRLGDVKRNFSDIRKAKKLLGYVPQVDLDTGLQLTWDFFKTRLAGASGS